MMDRARSPDRTKPRLVSLAAFVTTVTIGAEVAAQAPPAPPTGYEQAPPPTPQAVSPVPVYAPPGYAQPVYPPPTYYAPAPGYPPPGYSLYPPRPAKPVPMNPDDPPPGYHTESRARSGLVVGGAVMFGISYVLSALVAVSGQATGSSEYGPLFIPIVGPFIALGSTHALQATNDGLQQAGRALGAVGLVFDGVIQVAGASLIVVGLAASRDVVVRDPPPGVPEVGLGPGGATARWTF
jgi:hypothetical protein